MVARFMGSMLTYCLCNIQLNFVRTRHYSPLQTVSSHYSVVSLHKIILRNLLVDYLSHVLNFYKTSTNVFPFVQKFCFESSEKQKALLQNFLSNLKVRHLDAE